jgi:hypothetical protein
MATLKAAVFAQQVVRNDSRIAAISDVIVDRQELRFTCLPPLFVAWVVFEFEAPGGRTFSVATEVKSVTGRLLWFESCEVTAPPSGKGHCAVEVSFPVPTAGSYALSLLFETKAVWRRTVFFPLSESVH